MRGIITMFFMVTSLFVTAQADFNLTLLSNLDYPEECNDVWGYVGADGTEYAILGTQEATAIISLADPSNPIQVAYIPGASSVWRDMKSWGDYVYVTTDTGNDGLLIVNMAGAPSNITWEFWTPSISVNGQSGVLGSCHNLYIDENGFAYLSGCSNINNGGVLIIDVHTTPGQPTYIGAAAGIYSHDNFVRGDTLWSSDILDGFFSVQDLTDKTEVLTWNTQSTTTDFTHNAWLSDDGKYLFTTDERPNAFVDAYDVSELDDIKLLDSYQPSATAGEGVIPHNTHYIDGYLVTSWYTDGVVIVDAHRPDNMIKVGGYDSYQGPHGGFSGCWGAYPWLPSGIVLISDIQTGLSVLQPNYQRACYLEGQVTVLNSGGTPINGAMVEIVANEADTKTTDFMGEYKTGYATAGTYSVTFSKSGYLPKTVETKLVNGEVTTLNVELEEVPAVSLNVSLINEADGSPIFLGNVFFFNATDDFSAITNAQGLGTINNFFIGDYSIYAGAWGFLHEVDEVNIDESTGLIEIMLTTGYQDDFIFNLGWSVSGNANTGHWERDLPIGTNYQGGFSNVNVDIATDLGELCYMTDNGGGNAGNADVDDGEVILTSPLMDLTIYDHPEIRYSTWFFNDGGNQGSGPPNDSLIVSLNNGIEVVTLEVITQSNGAWRPESSFLVENYLEVTNTVQISFRTMDASNSGHLVEAGVDAFIVVEGDVTATNETEIDAFELTAFPNPFTENINLTYRLENQVGKARILVFNALGQQVEEKTIENNAGTIELGNALENGLYFIQMVTDKQSGKVLKVLKQ